jgi:hypothetical protein
MSTRDAEAAALAQSIQLLARAGFSPEEIAEGINSRLAQSGQPHRAKVVEVAAGVKGIEIDLTRRDGSESAPKPAAEACIGPHATCPQCNDELCARGMNLEKLPNEGACPACGSFLVVAHQGDTFSCRLMTDDEVIALPDDTRIRLQQQRRIVERLRSRSTR